MSKKVVFKFEGPNIIEDLKKPHVNLMLNMSSGLLPEHLTKDEVEILKEKFGDDWFDKLGYKEPEYKKPSFKEGE